MKSSFRIGLLALSILGICVGDASRMFFAGDVHAMNIDHDQLQNERLVNGLLTIEVQGNQNQLVHQFIGNHCALDGEPIVPEGGIVNDESGRVIVDIPGINQNAFVNPYSVGVMTAASNMIIELRNIAITKLMEGKALVRQRDIDNYNTVYNIEFTDVNRQVSVYKYKSLNRRYVMCHFCGVQVELNPQGELIRISPIGDLLNLDQPNIKNLKRLDESSKLLPTDNSTKKETQNATTKYSVSSHDGSMSLSSTPSSSRSSSPRAIKHSYSKFKQVRQGSRDATSDTSELY